jgi:ribosomal protein L12E/L44/L45/RPP1/RPP2
MIKAPVRYCSDAMTNFSPADSQLKEVLKAALVEVLTEQRETFADVLMEALEDVGLARAIESGAETAIVSRESIFQILDGDR